MTDAQIKPGDLVFQRSTSEQAVAIEAATDSSFTHCGIVVDRGGRLFVAEAIQPVRVNRDLRSLDNWVAAGVGRKATVMRVGNGLSAADLQRLEAAMRPMEGKRYDLLFQWDDRAIYCSEFIYDAFQRAGIATVGRREQFRDQNLSHPTVQELIIRRYQRNNIPFREEEPIITPRALAEAANVRQVTVLRR